MAPPATCCWTSPACNRPPPTAAGWTLIPPWHQREPASQGGRPDELSIRPDGPRTWLITGRNIAYAGVAASLRFALHLQVLGEARIEVTAEGERLGVRGGERLTLLVAGATSFVGPEDVSGVTRARQSRTLNLRHRRVSLPKTVTFGQATRLSYGV
jgi:hypothetical protein